MTTGKRFDDITFKRLVKMLPVIGFLSGAVYYGTVYKVKVDTLVDKMARWENRMDTIEGNTNRLVDELLEKK